MVKYKDFKVKHFLFGDCANFGTVPFFVEF